MLLSELPGDIVLYETVGTQHPNRTPTLTSIPTKRLETPNKTK